MNNPHNILVLDNYDSFTYNLVHYVEQLTGSAVEVYRNDKISLDEIARFDKIILSPGPGIPGEAGILIDLIRRYAPIKNILGVCLGQQAIAEAFGGKLINLPEVFHGVSTDIDVVKDDLLFHLLPKKLKVGRYHSWIVDVETLPDSLEVTAIDVGGAIMALRHKLYNVRGVQFHPESVLTEHGLTMIKNWLEHA